MFPVKLMRAESSSDSFNQIHDKDGGRIYYDKRCSVCHNQVGPDNIGRSKMVGGQMIFLTDDDLASLPVHPKEIVISQFIPAGQVDLRAFGKAYDIEPDPAGARIYVLLRQRMKAKKVAGIARFAMHETGKDSLAILYPHGDLLTLQVIAWPAEMFAHDDFRALRGEITVTEQEKELCDQLLAAMTRPWKPEEHVSDWEEAVGKLIAAKLEGGPPPEPPTPAQAQARQDIGEVLRASIAEQKERQKEKAA